VKLPRAILQKEKKMGKILILIVGVFVGIGSSQPFMNWFYYNLSPKSVEPGQPVTFECIKMGTTIYGYTTTWVVEPTPVNLKTTHIIRVTSKRDAAGLPMLGTSGPKLIFELSEPAVYRIEWDSTSDFKEDLGDTAVFEVLGPVGILNKEHRNVTNKTWNFWSKFRQRRVDGKLNLLNQ